MKILLLCTVLASTSASYAESSFNGVFCGDGEVSLQGKAYKGTKVVEVAVTDTELQLKRDHTDFGNGSYMDGRPEIAKISAGNIIYNGTIVGTISSSTLQTETIIAGYEIKYAINSLGSDSLSYTRTSVKDSQLIIGENFPALKLCQ